MKNLLMAIVKRKICTNWHTIYVYFVLHNFFHSLHCICSGYFELDPVSFQLVSENILFPNI